MADGPYQLEAAYFDGLLALASADAVQCFVELEKGRFHPLPVLAGWQQWRTQLNTANREHTGRVFAVDQAKGTILTVDEEPSVGIAVQRPVVRGSATPEIVVVVPGRRGRVSPLAERAC